MKSKMIKLKADRTKSRKSKMIWKLENNRLRRKKLRRLKIMHYKKDSLL